MTVDTLEISQRLQDAGLTKKAANEHAAIFMETVEDHLVSRKDLRNEVGCFCTTPRKGKVSPTKMVILL